MSDVASADVSRETPPAPEILGELAGAHAPQLVAYADILATRGLEHGVLGPRELPRIWERHIVNCALMAPALAQSSSVADLGSGAGLPGIVLAVLRPDCSFVLLEPLERRALFLLTVLEELGIANATVLRERAEAARGTVLVSTVTSRAVATLDKLAAWSLPLLEPAGRLLAIKGRSAEAELQASTRALRAAGAVRWSVDRYGEGRVIEPTTVVTVHRGFGTVARSPRKSAPRTARGPATGRKR